MENIKRIPYGVSDFIDVIERNQYYVDKTMYIPKLEDEADCLFFIRPRRFGKSIFLNMLHAYYDCHTKEKFQEWFGNLWIGQHPTPQQGKFLILHLDFSQVGGTIESLAENFNSYLGIELNEFMDVYEEYFPETTREAVRTTQQATDKLRIIQAKARTLRLPLFLIIDEYDNFTNTVLNEQGEKVYRAITHAEGFYRDIFKKFKGTFNRIFITGVSPVTLDDVTSGFNIGWNLTTKLEFNQMLGFSTEDVRNMLTYYKSKGKIRKECDIEKIIEDIKPWYDNYCFSADALKSPSKVFNCDMVLYYLRNLIEKGSAPEEMIDPNTKTDYNKMKKLLQLDKLDGDRKGIIRTITEEGDITASLLESFPASSITKSEVFPSLLFFYGMLTIKDVLGDQLVLSIPNNNVRKQYYEFLLEQYQDEKYINLNKLKTLFTHMAYDGKWQEALKYMADAYANTSSLRDNIEGERNIQGFFMAYLSLNSYYITAPELELNHGFCDFFLLPDLTHYASKHCYIIELKVLPKKTKATKQHANDAIAESQWQEAIAQIQHYATAPRVEALRQETTLHKIIMQFDGWRLHRMEEVL